MWTPPPGTNFDSKQQAAKADSPPSFALPNLFSNDAKKKATTTTAASTTVTKQQATAAAVDTVVEKPVYTDGGTKLTLTLTRLRSFVRYVAFAPLTHPPPHPTTSFQHNVLPPWPSLFKNCPQSVSSEPGSRFCRPSAP